MVQPGLDPDPDLDLGLVLRERFGFAAFRPGQREAIETLLRERRLLCIHGRYSLIRNAGCTLYSVYKNSAVFLASVTA